MAQRIPTTVITGFLGAGKTSLIRHIIENNGGRRLAPVLTDTLIQHTQHLAARRGVRHAACPRRLQIAYEHLERGQRGQRRLLPVLLELGFDQVKAQARHLTPKRKCLVGPL